MYKIIKRDGKIVDFDITKIANAIKRRLRPPTPSTPMISSISSRSRSRLTSCRR